MVSRRIQRCEQKIAVYARCECSMSAKATEQLTAITELNLRVMETSMLERTLSFAALVGIGATMFLSTVPTAQAQDPKKQFKFSGSAKVTPSAKITKGSIVNPSKPNPGFQQSNRSSNLDRNIAIGVGAAVIGGIIASQAARANSGGESMSCRSLERRCDDGQNWACRRLEVREDC